jgi:protein-tyrosine phosphatase
MGLEGCMSELSFLERMELFQVDDTGRLFISPAITDWHRLTHHSIDTVIDLDGEVDAGVPTLPNHCLYIYFPIYDEDLPNLKKLHGIARLGAELVREGHHVLSHCGMGFNRSALVAGLILNQLGMTGTDVVRRMRERRPGALFNERFAEYLSALPPV